MGKISLLLLVSVCLTNFLISVHSDVYYDEEGYNPEETDEDYNAIFPPAARAFLNDTTDDDYEEEPSEEIEIQAGVKIAFGNDAQQADFPHQVSMYSKTRGHFCGASIIHPFLILCAAHCFDMDKPPFIEVRAGKHRMGTLGENTEQVRDVIAVRVHKNYSKTTWDNDIAIVMLNQSLELNEHVKPIRLRNPSWELPEHANVSGWGISYVKGRGKRRWQEVRTADTLQVARVPFIPRETCTQMIKNFKYNLTANMICAGANGADACQGDSGGPLTCARNGTTGEEERYLCGIVSWGFHCAPRRKRLPGFYTDVTKYTAWIRKYMRTWWSHYWTTLLAEPRRGRSDCGEGKFHCPNNNLCIPEEFKCDGENDCHPLEDWDERNCTSKVCAVGRFQCNSTQACIHSRYVCDGDDDCEDRSDELGCEKEEQDSHAVPTEETRQSFLASFFGK